MSETLASSKAFTFRVHAITEQLLPSGQKVDLARNSTVAIQRPDRFNIAMVGDAEEMHFVYDGKQVTLHNVKNKVYGQIPMPPTIDAALDTLAKTHGLVIPLADLVESDSYKALAPLVKSGDYLGTGYVFDTKCHHLAFRQEAVDWQIWIDEGPTPLPRKVVITYKNTPAQLKYVAYLSDWNLSPQLAESTFTFTPPAGDKKIEALAPATRPAGQ